MFCSQIISVYILVRQKISALGLQSVLCREKDMEVVVLQPDSLTNLQAIVDFRPDIVITDSTTYNQQPVAVLDKIRRSQPTRFLFLCASAGREATEIMSLGADGVIASFSPAELLAAAVRSLAGGRMWIDENIWRGQLNVKDSENVSPLSQLSYREIEVLKMVAEGFSNREIAEAMNLSHDMIRCYMRLIVRKLRARGRTHAVSLARECGVLS